MNTNLQYSALMYVLYVAKLFFSKKKVNSLENRIYGGILIHTIVTLIVDIISRTYAINNPLTMAATYLFKFNMCLTITYPLLFSYYVFCITSKKHIELIPFKEHPHRKFFKNAEIGLYFIIIITWIICLILPVNLHIDNKIFTQDGLLMYGVYFSGLCCCIAWIIMLLINHKRLKSTKEKKSKKYTPIYVFILLYALAVFLQISIPQISWISTIITFVTVLIYHTIENPDVELINKLNKAKQEAEDANKAKTDFLSNMSHEIRTPLNAIIGFGQALAKEDISGKAKEEVQDILMASTALLDIVNGILDISKIEANKIEIVENEYSTKKMLNEVTSLINARIGSKPIDFKILIDDKLPAVLYGDSTRIKQIMINLLTNSVKYTEEGRILFQVKANNENNICKMTIEVADTGMGMTQESLEQLFIKFQRFDSEKNSNVEGTGLGMAITKGLIELMNGNIQVKSKYEEGTTFVVTIEQKIISMVQEEIVEESDKVEAFNASGSKVLVVDDNKINLKVAERLLKDYRITVETANSGYECIDNILNGKKYDLIFMDIMMPKMNGIETLENLKSIVGFNMPVVALTADVISGMEEKYISKGFDDCLAKPIVEEELYYMLRKFLKEASTETSQVQIETTVSTPAVEETSVVQKTSVVEEPPVALKSTVVEEPPVISEDTHTVEYLEKNNVNVSAGLELLKDMEMYEMTLEEFYNELLNKLEELRGYKESGNMDDYAILAHALKTEARYVGCNELGDMAYEHELAGKAKDQQQVNEKFDSLETEIKRVHDIVQRYFN